MTAVQADVVRPGRYDYGVGSDLRACTPQNFRSHPAISPEHSAPYPIRRLGRLKSLRVEQLSPVLAGVLRTRGAQGLTLRSVSTAGSASVHGDLVDAASQKWRSRSARSALDGQDGVYYGGPRRGGLGGNFETSVPPSGVLNSGRVWRKEGSLGSSRGGARQGGRPAGTRKAPWRAWACSDCTATDIRSPGCG